MSENIGNLEKRLMETREKIRTKRREITGGKVEDKIKDMGKRTYEELDKDLNALHKVALEGKEKAKDKGAVFYDELVTDISAARTKLKDKRLEITGGVAETKAKEAAKTIKEKGESALRAIEEDIARISEKLRGKSKEE